MKFTNRRIANTIIISTLLVASIASIGFSSWLIEGGGVKEDNGVVDIEVGKVGDFTDCVTINESKDTEDREYKPLEKIKDNYHLIFINFATKNPS